jgi:hypothetical protein
VGNANLEFSNGNANEIVLRIGTSGKAKRISALLSEARNQQATGWLAHLGRFW